MIKSTILLCILVIFAIGSDKPKIISQCVFDYELCVDRCIHSDKCYYEMEECSDVCIDKKKKCKENENK